MPATVVSLNNVPEAQRERIRQAGFTLHSLFEAPDRMAALRALSTEVRALVTNSAVGLREAEIAALPKLEIVCAVGAGYDAIDIPAATARGIVVTHGPGANATTVADHAMALLLAIARNLRAMDATVRAGEWGRGRVPRPMVTGKRIGLLGLGIIGTMIARRAENGFGMQVAYCTRTPRPGVPYEYCETPLALAARSDFLVVATPGGPATHHLVDAAVLDALGPEGYLINIGRGSVVDTESLIAALSTGHLGGAALDVVEGEPNAPSALATLPNVIMTPHMAGLSPESLFAAYKLVIDNMLGHFSGSGVITPVKPHTRNP
jgi:lactate dehydrogenase-like 2-hydroxyacid dehydrogenase